ncbi:uncharacterized protein LY79DRAFT_576381 [Colletotrichum navitas]|nr:uncharacterized protein LY79DRAFT_576381 [Colletotrichum navitas]KAK1598077.1 hypothetical protein LY79DRAFT_576381 [Colletotrichum navitas]
MQSSRFQSITSRFSPSTLRTTFRRSSSASSRASSDRGSYTTTASSPVSTINSIVFSQPSMLDLEEERKSFGSELSILEPRPVVYFGSVEERIGSLHKRRILELRFEFGAGRLEPGMLVNGLTGALRENAARALGPNSSTENVTKRQTAAGFDCFPELTP